jgi:L-ascorbate metabolism protein UlaG (beta-lactamase superfamily)
VIGSWELYNYFSQQGLEALHPLNPGGKVTYEFGMVKAVAAQHSSSFQDGSYAGVACGFIVQTADGTFYYSGDAALSLDMTLIPMWAEIDFAVFPVGDVLTMGVEDAIEAAKIVKTDQVLGVHYDTFGFIKIDKASATQKFETSKIKLHLPKIGETIVI